MSTHGECKNYTNDCEGVGFCSLKKKTVNANDPACPQFEGK